MLLVKGKKVVGGIE